MSRTCSAVSRTCVGGGGGRRDDVEVDAIVLAGFSDRDFGLVAVFCGFELPWYGLMDCRCTGGVACESAGTGRSSRIVCRGIRHDVVENEPR